MVKEDKFKIMKRIVKILLLATIMLLELSTNTFAGELRSEDSSVIVSMGDSYSSGEGIEPFFGQDLPLSLKVKNYSWLAHRSENAWSGMLSLPSLSGTMSENADNWYFVAASGATTANINGIFEKTYYKKQPSRTLPDLQDTVHLPSQISIFEKLKEEGKTADYVTITIGGNDVDFAGAVTAAVCSSTYLTPAYLSDKINNTWKDFYEGGIRESICSTYEEIHKAAGKDARIIVAGYPKLLDPGGSVFLFSEDAAQCLNRAVSQFNDALESIVYDYRTIHGYDIWFVSVEEAFQGHGAYSDAPYLNGVIIGTRSEDINDSEIISSYSMHPNYEGACIYAECVQSKIDELEGVLSESSNTKYNTDLLLSVYDINNSAYNDYTIDITGTYNTGWFGWFEKDYSEHIVINDSNSQAISLNANGNYVITITDNKDDSKTYSKSIEVSNEYPNKRINFSTNFGVMLATNIYGDYEESDIPADAVEFNGHYYYVYNLDTVTTWEEAKEYCESQGGYLATITSQEEDEFLYSYITDMGFESGLFGLSNTDQDDAWTWVTGEPFSYENWASEEPAQQLASGTERYALYDTQSSSGHWRALDEGTSAIVSIFVKNVSSDLNLRELPQHDSNLNGTVSDDTPLKYYGETGQGLGSDGIMHDWYKVYVDENLQGWVRSDLVQIVDHPAANPVHTFICEWDIGGNEAPQEPVRTTSDERDIVLVLDTSGSMSGTPIEETRKAATNFVNTVLEEDASIGIITYEDRAEQLSDFSVDKNHLTEIAAGISSGGGTNIESGLVEAKSMLDSSNAKKKIIVLMSDGEPNEGKEGEELIAYADEIKNDDILIYTLGFFENMGGNKSSAQYLMEHLASEGCHYEVASADDLVFFFEDMADQINGQKYIYIRIACPVDVTVTYNGETLCSAEDDLNVRTDFGTLTFEDSENESSVNNDDLIKVLRLKEGADYNVQIVGTGRGIMDYTIGFMDENGDYTDFRRFENIKITKQTVIDTVAAVSDESVLNIDEDGDGKYDLRLRAEENGYGKEIETPVWFYVGIGGGTVLLIIVILVVVKKRKNKKKGMVKS